MRAQSHAIRMLNLFSALKRDIHCIGGTVSGVGAHGAVHLKLPDGTEIVLLTTIGVPTSVTLHEAINNASGKAAAILYDHVGLQEKWLKHLAWLGANIPAVRWVQSSGSPRGCSRAGVRL